MNEKEREILDICCTDNLEFKFEHFKNINELLEQIDKWYWNDDIEYTRWFGLNDLYILSIYISKLSEKNIKLEETKIKILESEIERLQNLIDKTTNYYLKTLSKNGSMPDEAVEMFNLLEENKK